MTVYNDSSIKIKKGINIKRLMCCTNDHEIETPSDYFISPGASWKCPKCEEVQGYVWSSHKQTHVWCVIDKGDALFNGLGELPVWDE